ncbi:MAG: hypothetical protein RLY58_1334 [Pseudomonadota bacterium]|jgi:carbonic anhydrase
MKNKLLLSVLCAVLTVPSAWADSRHWEYDGEEGPTHWADLDPSFSSCNSKNQSPIDLTPSRMVKAQLAAIRPTYQAGGQEIVNNGHTIQVNYATGSDVVIDGIVFHLKQFHFHAPSENQIKGQSFPMEGHFVHADDQGNLAVIAVMFQAGKANPELEKAFAHIPSEAGTSTPLNPMVNAAALLPAQKDYYRFEGSLTTPPCSEGVRWLVLKQVQQASAAQIAQFTQTLHHANNRPIQATNARLILQ